MLTCLHTRALEWSHSVMVTVVKWCQGVPGCYHGAMVPVCGGAKVVPCWFHGAKVVPGGHAAILPCYYGAWVPWYHAACHIARVPWSLRCWNADIPKSWNGAMLSCCQGPSQVARVPQCRCAMMPGCQGVMRRLCHANMLECWNADMLTPWIMWNVALITQSYLDQNRSLQETYLLLVQSSSTMQQRTIVL